MIQRIVDVRRPSSAGGLSWWDTALGILNFWLVTSSHGELGTTKRTDSWEANGGRPKQSYLSTLIRDDGTKTKKELRTLLTGNACLGTPGFVV